MSVNRIRLPFVIAGLYDCILGLAFLFAHEAIFAFFEVTPPNHPGYVQFAACLLVVFGVMFFHIATNPVRWRVLMPYGMALKVSYSGLAFWYQATSGIPFVWLPWAWIDLGFLLAFVLAWFAAGHHSLQA